MYNLSLTLQNICANQPGAFRTLVRLGLLDDSVFGGWTLEELCVIQQVEPAEVVRRLKEGSSVVHSPILV